MRNIPKLFLFCWIAFIMFYLLLAIAANAETSVSEIIKNGINTQKALDISNQQHTLDITLERKVTEQKPDGTIIITETKPSNITIEAIDKKSDDYKTLDDTLSKLGMALLLFKKLGGL